MARALSVLVTSPCRIYVPPLHSEKSIYPSDNNTRRIFNIVGEQEQANWDVPINNAAILKQQNVLPFSFSKRPVNLLIARTESM